MKNSRMCSKCLSSEIVRIPDTAHRYLANSIPIVKGVWVNRVPVVRYVCCDCGFVEDWVENRNEREMVWKNFG